MIRRKHRINARLGNHVYGLLRALIGKPYGCYNVTDVLERAIRELAAKHEVQHEDLGEQRHDANSLVIRQDPKPADDIFPDDYREFKETISPAKPSPATSPAPRPAKTRKVKPQPIKPAPVRKGRINSKKKARK